MALHHLFTSGVPALRTAPLTALLTALLMACHAMAGAATPRVAGLPLAGARMTNALSKVDTDGCSGGVDVKRVHDGLLQGRPFRMFTVLCAYGNTTSATQVVAFHDGSRYTRVLSFNAMEAASPVTVLNDSVVFEAVVEKPGDARCCPTGRAVMALNTRTGLATARAKGFNKVYPPARAQVLN